MSGYLGNPDAESEHAIIVAENGIQAARDALPTGESAYACYDCGEPIPLARRQAQRGCKFCVVCQPYHDNHRKVKMLDRIL